MYFLNFIDQNSEEKHSKIPKILENPNFFSGTDNVLYQRDFKVKKRPTGVYSIELNKDYGLLYDFGTFFLNNDAIKFDVLIQDFLQCVAN